MSAREKNSELKRLDLAVRRATEGLLDAMRGAGVDELVITMQASTGRVTFERRYHPREENGEAFFADPAFERPAGARGAR